jgi:hypothetical protein
LCVRSRWLLAGALVQLECLTTAQTHPAVLPSKTVRRLAG